MTGLRIAFAGTPAFALPALQALLDSPHTVVGVLTQPDRPSGRGRKLTASVVKQAALDKQLAVSQPATLKSESGRADLAAWQPDVLVVVAYGLILPNEVLALPRLGCVNIHASLLPRWRGAAPIQRAILAGDTESGITIMQMNAGLDTGPILLQRSVPIEPGDTSGSLHDRLAPLGASVLLDALARIENGAIQPRPQPEIGVTYAAKIDKAEATIDWARDSREIERKIRAFNPWPVAETLFEGESLKIQSARISATEAPESCPIDAPAGQSGSILGLEGDGIRVRCGRGVLSVTRVQRPGRRPISAVDFAHASPLSEQRFG